MDTTQLKIHAPTDYSDVCVYFDGEFQKYFDWSNHALDWLRDMGYIKCVYGNWIPSDSSIKEITIEGVQKNPKCRAYYRIRGFDL